MTCNKQKITKHDRFGIFRSSLEIVMSGIMKDYNYLYYKYGLFMGMEDKRLRDYYPCHTDMITYSLSAHKHIILHFLEKLKKQSRHVSTLACTSTSHMQCAKDVMTGWTHLLWILMK